MVSEERASALPELAGLGLRAAQAAVTRFLTDAGIEGAARDARLLVSAALRIEPLDLIKAPDRPFDADEAARLKGIAERRAAHEPVSRILGERGFYGRMFRVTPATLDPRPCTETVIDAVLEIVRDEGWIDRPLRILDVGTGSGAILVTLLAELPNATGLGTDISEAALAVARENADALGVGGRAEFLLRRGFEGVDDQFDIVVSNPPYIPTADIAGLDPDVRAYDPLTALDGGSDGLEVYRALAAGIRDVVPRGWMVVEVGAGQAKDVAHLLSQGAGHAVARVKTWADLGRHTRCVAVNTQLYPSL